VNPAVDSVGPAWSLPAMRAAQAQAWTAIERLAAAIHPGLRESEAKALGEAIMADLGMGQAWHPMMVRFGANTLRVFSDRGGEDLALAENDIFFIDIGPVLLGHEADVGASFAVGHDPEMHACAAAARDLWHRVAAIWNQGAVRGTALYARAEQEARPWAGTSTSTCAATAWPTTPPLAPGRQARRSRQPAHAGPVDPGNPDPPSDQAFRRLLRGLAGVTVAGPEVDSLTSAPNWLPACAGMTRSDWQW
jgi:hypothetical protein